MRARIELRRRHYAESRKASVDEHPAGGRYRSPVIPLRAPGPECPAHPGQPRYECEVCAV
jgi:hypothetical protein